MFEWKLRVKRLKPMKHLQANILVLAKRVSKLNNVAAVFWTIPIHSFITAMSADTSTISTASTTISTVSSPLSKASLLK